MIAKSVVNEKNAPPPKVDFWKKMFLDNNVFSWAHGHIVPGDNFAKTWPGDNFEAILKFTGTIFIFSSFWENIFKRKFTRKKAGKNLQIKMWGKFTRENAGKFFERKYFQF